MATVCPHCSATHPSSERFCPTTGKPLAARPIGVGAVLADRYEIIRQLGAGAMGVVFEGRHRELGKRVAIKTIRSEIAGEQDLMARFRQEAIAASAIGHPHIVQVFDLGSSGGSPYMIMEYLAGRSLAELLEEEPTLEPARAARIVDQALSALAAAHAQSIIHRDLKPENIFLQAQPEDPEFVKLLDFGIAKVLADADTMRFAPRDTPRPTEYGTVMGTPWYMAPEQARGLTDVDHRADLWAIGCVLYECLCGRTPFQGDNYNQVLGAILDGRFPRPRELRPELPPALEVVTLRALGYDRANRYASAQTMRDELAAALRSGAPAAATAVLPPAAATASGAGAEVTGLALAAGARDDAAAAAAFDKLANASLVSLDGDDEPRARARAAPKPAAAAPKPAAPRPAKPSADAFAPPESERAAALDVVLPVTTAARGKPSVAAQRARLSGNIHEPARGGRARPRSRAGAVFKGLFLLLLVGAGAGAGYRYYKLGYLIQPPPPKPLIVRVQVTPTDAELVLDGKPQPLGDFEVMPKEAHTVELRAPGRLGVRVALAAATREPPPLAFRLPIGLVTLPADPVAVVAAAPPEGVSYAAVDAAVVKLARARVCLASFDALARQQEDAYRGSTGKRGPSADAPPQVAALPGDELPRCRNSVTAAAESKPAMPEVDAAARAYVAELDRLVPLTGEAAVYYGQRNYDSDGLRWGRKHHAELVERYASTRATADALLAALAAEEVRWRAAELAALEAESGVSAMWHLRATALHAELWARAAASGQRGNGKVIAERAEAFLAALDAARAYLDAHRDEAAALANGAGYLDSLAPLRPLAAVTTPSAVDRADILRWYNASVGVFNAIVLVR